MFDERSYEGYWWTPEYSERKVPGTLKFGQETGIQLNLLTSIREDNSQLGSSEEVVQFDKILGKTTGGEDITIVDCMRSNASLSFGGTLTETYEGISLLVGQRFTGDIEFSGLKIKSELINAWAERSATTIDSTLFDKESSEPVQAEAGDVTEIKAEIPESITAQLDGINVEIVNEISTNINRRGGGTITDETIFKITSNEAISLDDLTNYSKNIEDFVSLALGKECLVEELVGIGTDERPDTEILYVIQGSKKDTQIHPYKTNFILPDVVDGFEEVMENWFNLVDEFSQPINLYFSTRYNDRMYVNNEFFSLIQSIEVYHRLSDQFDGSYLTEEEYEKYKSELEGTIKAEFDEGFSSHLKNGTFEYANEYSLAKRITNLIRDIDHILEDLPWNYENQVRAMVDARNDLTHKGDAGVSTGQLHEFTLILRSLFEALILLDIGIDQDQIRERLGKRYTELK
jgi:hypothetical protein